MTKNINDEVRNKISDSITEDEFFVVKRKFEKDINSNRRYEQITNVGDLLDVLEDRLLLSPQHLDPLYEICKYISKLNGDASFIKSYFLIKENYIEAQDEDESEHLNNGGPVLSQSVVGLITSNIGSDWPEFARHLQIRSAELGATHDSKETTSKILFILEVKSRRVCQKELYFKLLKALAKCKRNDLKKEVERMISWNHS